MSLPTDRKTETESLTKSGKSQEREKSVVKKRCKSKKKHGPSTGLPKTCEQLAKEKQEKAQKLAARDGSKGKQETGAKDGKGVQNQTKGDQNMTKAQKKKRPPKTTRKVSNLVFVMPKEADPQAKVQAASEKKIGKLMRYMKKYWSIHVDKKFYPVKVDFRMPDRMTHQRPENWWLIKRARQKTLDHTGFFSNVREPYHDLGPPELDTAMLVFKNMHEDLLTDPTKWIQDRQLKDELIKKCNAPLVRLPRTRVRRPQYNKGRVKIGAGGMLNIDKFVKTGYDFQNGIRGGVSFTMTLDSYMEQKENEVADLASAFGVVVKNKAPKQPEKAESAKSKTNVRNDSDVKRVVTALQLASDNKKNSTTDDRANQRNMNSLEQMMQAIYDMVRSLLNMRNSQLRSNHPLPLRVVQAIRSTSPVVHQQRKGKKRTDADGELTMSCKDIQARSAATSAVLHTNAATSATKRNTSSEEEENKEETESEWEEMEEHEEETAEPVSAAMSVKALIHHRGKHVLEGHEGDNVEHEDHIASTIVDTVRKAHEEKDSTSYNLETKVKNMRESPEQATQRMLNREEAYTRLFTKGDPSKPPIWKSINVDIVFGIEGPTGPEDEMNEASKEMDEFHAAHDSNAALQLPSTQKIPHVNEIPTPKLPGTDSPVRIDSEEQSRLNLLQKNPEAARREPPPSPVLNLYKVAGIETNERQMYTSLMTLKKKFRASEKSLRFYYANETEKEDWETMDRYKRKIRAILPCPIYEKSIAIMRRAVQLGLPAETVSTTTVERRPALWYRKLRERCDETGATRHLGCSAILLKLFKYCDVDMKSRPKMLNRFCLLIVSLPTTELAKRSWQLAIRFLMDYLLGTPIELFYQWLEYRRLPSLL